MTNRQKEIQQLEQLIEQKKKKVKTLPEFSKDMKLIDIEDFPYRHGNISVSIRYKGIITVNNLIHSSVAELLNIYGLGKCGILRIVEWMNKHGIVFDE